MSSPLGAVGITASAGAETRLALTNGRRDREKGRSACLAFAFDRACTGAVSHQDRGLRIANAAAVASASAVSVTCCARRNKILGRIVGAIEVEVVDDQGAVARATTRRPGHGSAAPVAGMCARPDLVVEHNPGNNHETARRRQRMTWRLPHSPRHLLNANCGPVRGEIAGVTAETVGPCSRLLERTAAMVTRMDHTQGLYIRKEQV